MIVGFLQCRTPCFRGFTFKSCTGRIEELFTRRYNNRCLRFNRARHSLRGTEGRSLASPRRSVFRVTCRHYWNGPNSCQSLSTICMGLRVMTSCRQYWNGPGAGRSVSSRIYLQVIGTVSSQSAPSVLLFTDSQRYLFNCGESIHRLSCDLDISMDPGRIFLTGNQWQHIGGLSYIQYQPQALEPNAGIEVHGPAGTEDFVHSLYTFSKRHLVTKPSITCFDHHPSSLPLYKDDNVSIQTVILEDSNPAQGLPDDSLCFICKLADPPGKFLAERAQELGIPVGHMRKELLSGNPVVLPDGRTVSMWQPQKRKLWERGDSLVPGLLIGLPVVDKRAMVVPVLLMTNHRNPKRNARN